MALCLRDNKGKTIEKSLCNGCNNGTKASQEQWFIIRLKYIYFLQKNIQFKICSVCIIQTNDVMRYSCTGCSLNVIIYCDSVSVTLFLLIDPSGELTGILWSPIDCAISGGVHPLHVQWRVMVIEWAVDGKEGHWPKQQHGGGRGAGCVCVG